MIDENKFIVEDGEKSFTLKVLEKTDITDAELAEILGNDRIAKMQKLQLDKKREQFKELRPTGLTHTPQDTQDYRKALEDKAVEGDKEAIKEMEFFQGKFAYNEDGSVKLLTLEGGKTFCADLTERGGYANWVDADELAKSKGYRLPTDWNAGDKQADKEATDWYKLEQYFGDYSHTGALTHILGCIPGRYWTGTKYENQEGVARVRLLIKDNLSSYGYYTNYTNRVCGFKDSM